MTDYRRPVTLKDDAYYEALANAIDQRFTVSDPGRSVFSAPPPEPERKPMLRGFGFPAAAPRPLPAHGTESRYKTHKCKCELCKAAGRRRSHKADVRKKALKEAKK